MLDTADGTRIAHLASELLPDGGLLTSVLQLDLRDDRTLYFTGLDARDNLTIYAAEPFLSAFSLPARSRQK